MFWNFHALQMKKKYCGWSFTKLPEYDTLPDGKIVFRFEEKLKIRGLDSERRDVAPFIKRIVAKLIEMLVKPTLEDEKFGLTGFLMYPDHEYLIYRKKMMMNQISSYIHLMTCQLASGAVLLEDLAIGKKLKDDYKKDVAHSYVARKMNERGQKVEVGSKIHIIKIRIKRQKEIYQWEEIEHVKSQNIDVDYDYYLRIILIPILERLLIIPNLFTKHDIRLICNEAIQILPQTMKQSSKKIESYFIN
jgi:DNA polymerase elongation subunit (family B)